MSYLEFALIINSSRALLPLEVLIIYEIVEEYIKYMIVAEILIYIKITLCGLATFQSSLNNNHTESL